MAAVDPATEMGHGPIVGGSYAFPYGPPANLDTGNGKKVKRGPAVLRKRGEGGRRPRTGDVRGRACEAYFFCRMLPLFAST